MFNGLKLSHKMTLMIAGVVLTALSVFAVTISMLVNDFVDRSAQKSIEARHSYAKTRLVGYLDGISDDLANWSKNPMTMNALKRFSRAWKTVGADPVAILHGAYIDDNPHPLGEKDKLDAAPDKSLYNNTHKYFHYMFRQLKDDRGYYDVFLISVDGDIVYTVYKELDFATNLMTGAYKNSGLAQVFRGAMESDAGTAVPANKK